MPAYRCWQEVWADHGVELPLALWVPCLGTTDALDPFAELEARLGRAVDRAAVDAWRHARFAELLAEQGLLPGVADYVEAARARGLKLAVASSSSRDWVRGHLGRLGLLDAFHAIRTSDDVARVKPAPDLYLAVLEALAVGPARALVLEDSPNGVLAARRAGITRVVAVPNQLTRGLPLEAADLVVPSLAEVPLETLLGRLSGAVTTIREEDP